MIAQDKVEVQVGAVTGAWNVAVQTADNRLGLSSGAFRYPMVMSQTQSQVIATVNDPALVLSRQGLGTTSNPRALSVIGLELGLAGSPTRVTLLVRGRSRPDVAYVGGGGDGLRRLPVRIRRDAVTT